MLLLKPRFLTNTSKIPEDFDKDVDIEELLDFNEMTYDELCEAMFAGALSQKSNQLSNLYDEVLDSIKRYEVRVGYQEIDEHKDKLLKVKQDIEELLQSYLDVMGIDKTADEVYKACNSSELTEEELNIYEDYLQKHNDCNIDLINAILHYYNDKGSEGVELKDANDLSSVMILRDESGNPIYDVNGEVIMSGITDGLLEPIDISDWDNLTYDEKVEAIGGYNADDSEAKKTYGSIVVDAIEKEYNMKKIYLVLIFIFLIIGVFIGIILTYTNQGVITTPRITAPYEEGVNYEYSSEEFENCYEDSETIYDVAKCYNDRNFQLKSDGEINNVGNINVILRTNKGYINEYVISSTEYKVYLGDVGHITNTSVVFSYPDNKIINSETTKIKDYNEVHKEDINSIKKTFDNEKEIKVYDSEIIIPFEEKNSKEILEKATFSKNNSEEVLNELTNLGIM